jgi:hypothetical protein
MTPIVSHVHHLFYATPDLDTTIRDLELVLGVRASTGGQHLGRGTRNALIAIGEHAYLEIIGPDPDQPAPNGPRWFTIDTIDQPRLVTWAAHGTDLGRLVATTGATLGAVTQGRRLRQDGVTLSWQLTDPNVMLGDGVVPFFIDWGMSPHPSSTAVHGPRLIDLRGEHPEDGAIRATLAQLDIPLAVTPSGRPALVATLDTAAGSIELR